MPDLRQQIIGRRNKAAGETFERWISDACEFYLHKGLAYIEKTPEPFHITGKDRNGVVRGYYEKKGQPDYKGILCDGTGIMFEAKHTDSDRISQTVITDAQWKGLDIYEGFGAHCYVMVSMGLTRFYRVPWSVWKGMKELFGHKFMTAQELEPYRLQERRCTILILEGVELRNEDTERGTRTEAEQD
ncbi:Holliday junction resolvase RecU [Acetatifactor aquisgranensis]|uniref:Holliday junction resolvase RecU n=1 Tax=Acetatifactor aquisgranensis TaxID=2941233 RepID=UPI002041DC8A|nr:Holliday junction resolvase RecU [Acetatifactor aquisgranensis]